MNRQATLAEDPDVKLPKSVREAAERSKAMFDAVQRGEQVSTAPIDEDAADTMHMVDPAKAQAAQETQPEVTPEGNPEEPPAAQAPVTPEGNIGEAHDGDPNESWEHKYNSVLGRYKRSQEQVRDLTQRVVGLESVIATMKVAPPASATPATELNFGDIDLTDDERNDYGEDFLKVVGKKAKAEIIPLLQQSLERVKQLEARLDGVTSVAQSTVTEKLHTFMDANLPSWRDINQQNEFVEWLGLPDPFSGGIRHNMLKEAYAAGNAPRVLAFFKGFLSEEAALAPATTREPDPGAQKVPKVPLADLAAPGRAKTAATAQTPAEKPIITRAQVAAFYADSAAGKYRGRDAERQKLEAQIFDAQREGRIR
jgi:hypothetical protein